MNEYFGDITKRSEKLIRICGTRDPFVIAKALGISVIYADGLKRLKGMYRVIKRNRFIILNSGNTETMNAVVCAHELGHDQLHREYAKNSPIQEFMLYDMASRREYEANIFASELLLDDKEILEYVWQGYDSLQIAKATETDINLVALKVDSLIRKGYTLTPQEHNSKFLK
jgi:Zn-dependent peptidase ImmA (M78 family)